MATRTTTYPAVTVRDVGPGAYVLADDGVLWEVVDVFGFMGTAGVPELEARLANVALGTEDPDSLLAANLKWVAVENLEGLALVRGCRCYTAPV